MRLLVVEDNPKLAELLVRRLTEGGYAVDAVADAADAVSVMAMNAYDLIVLDLTLPDGDGRTILKDMRRRGDSVPVLVATARSDMLQRVGTLDEGADDYLVKPFSPDELLARVRALLRRPRQTFDTVLTAGNVALDTALLTVSIAGAATEMTRREITVLAMLIREQDKLVPRRRLEEAVYSADN